MQDLPSYSITIYDVEWKKVSLMRMFARSTELSIQLRVPSVPVNMEVCLK